MKIETNVMSVSENGEELQLRLSGWPTTAPEGTFARDYHVAIPANARAKRAFYIGRKVVLHIDPQ